MASSIPTDGSAHGEPAIVRSSSPSPSPSTRDGRGEGEQHDSAFPLTPKPSAAKGEGSSGAGLPLTCCAHPDAHAHHASLAEHRAVADAICLDQVSFGYPETEPGAERLLALRDVTLHVPQGCSLGIIGPNGAGKTTLLKIILGLLDGYQGQARVLGFARRAACRRGDLVGYVPQRHGVEWRFPVTVRQVGAHGTDRQDGLAAALSAD